VAVTVSSDLPGYGTSQEKEALKTGLLHCCTDLHQVGMQGRMLVCGKHLGPHGKMAGAQCLPRGQSTDHMLL